MIKKGKKMCKKKANKLTPLIIAINERKSRKRKHK